LFKSLQLFDTQLLWGFRVSEIYPIKMGLKGALPWKEFLILFFSKKWTNFIGRWSITFTFRETIN